MVCQNLDYQKFCAQVCRAVPACEEVNREFFCLPSLIGDFSEIGIATQLFELAKLLTKKRLIQFRSVGTCMYPYLKPGNILHVEPKNAKQIGIDEIAVYRRFNSLFAHRVILKGKDNDKDYIITRSDAAKDGDDGPIFDEDILGIVSNIKRGYKNQLFFNLCIKWRSFRCYLFGKIISLISRIQYMVIYQKIAQFLFAKLNKKIDFSIHTPLNWKTNNRFYKILTAEEFTKLNLNIDESSIAKYILLINVNSKPAASLSLIAKPKDCPFSGWWISDLIMKTKYQGTDLQEELLNKIEELMKQSKVRRIFVGLMIEEHLKRKFFKKIGFKEIRVTKNGSFDRIILQKEIV